MFAVQGIKVRMAQCTSVLGKLLNVCVSINFVY